MLKYIIYFLLIAGFTVPSHAKLDAIRLDQNWKQNIAERAPKKVQAEPKKPRKVLIFSLATGYKHWCIPHTQAVIEILGDESGAYESVTSKDVEVFRPESLKQYDAVVLNNTCPQRGERNLFHDVIIDKIGEEGKKYADMPLKAREELAQHLYESLVDYVAEGGGLVLLHGAITSFNYSDEFSQLAGGSFDYHPRQQEVTLHPVVPDHPILKPFGGEPFVHYDEPYILGGAYEKMNFAPMLEMETSSIQVNSEKQKKAIAAIPRYVAWIKTHEKGRVFFSSPSHNAQSFHQPELLSFLLNGMQYAIGDLDCDDAPLNQ
ncbi:ThuA domain-containing protein [Coraliomargarita sinensis]|nr:ThuA domain-containing protein [Coraliomargarita sinensis]